MFGSVQWVVDGGQYLAIPIFSYRVCSWQPCWLVKGQFIIYEGGWAGKNERGGTMINPRFSKGGSSCNT